MPRTTTRIGIKPARVWQALMGISLILIVVDVFFQVTNELAAPTFPGWETSMIIMDVDSESSVPTWWGSLLLSAAAVLTAVVAHSSRQTGQADQRFYWAIAAIFVLLSIDEQAMIHEHAIVPMRERFGLGGLLYFGWVAPAAIAVGFLIAVTARFVFRHPPGIRRLLILAAGLYLAGALVLEMVGGWWSETHGPDNLQYQSLTTLEELLEFVGVSIYILAMMYLLVDRQSSVELSFEADESPD